MVEGGWCRELRAYPLGDGRRTGHLQLHELKLGAPQLLLGSQEIAGVSPEGGRVHGYYRRTCRPIEAGDELTSLPMVSHIFTLMGVGTGEYERRQMLSPHHLT